MSDSLRTCVATRERRPQSHLLRLVADGSGHLRVDLDGKAAGRGAWLKPELPLLAALEKRPSKLSRALRQKGLSGRGLVADARRAATARALIALQACRHSGLVVSGPWAVDHAPDLVAMIFASSLLPHELAQREVTRLRGQPSLPIAPALAARLPADRDIETTVALPLSAVELGQRIGTGPRSVIGIKAARPSRQVVRWLRCCRSLGYPPR